MKWRILLAGLLVVLQLALMGCSDDTKESEKPSRPGRLPPEPAGSKY